MGYEFGRQHGLMAALIGTVHDRFCKTSRYHPFPTSTEAYVVSEGDVTTSLLRTGQWENLLRNLSMEIAHFYSDISALMESTDPQAMLLDMELVRPSHRATAKLIKRQHYVRLYGNGIALRALQERLIRIQRASDNV